MGALEEFLNEGLERVILSSPADGEEIRKVRIRPILLRGELVFQAEEQRGTQAFHKNMNREETAAYVAGLLAGSLKQMELSAAGGTVHALVSKKGKMTVKIRRKMAVPAAGLPAPASHNRRKRYVLEEGKPVPFLVDLGVMTGDGQVVRSRYDKFRQINRFLEFIEDILPRLDRERENVIIDFGCGKSYLTFAMYYYLKELKGYSIRVIGLDLKKDVIARCNLLAERYGFDRLRFYHGDIASYEGVDQVDMVVTLHACDTATDYALAKAVGWSAEVILSVPCCQHELNAQFAARDGCAEVLAPVMDYGLLRERFAALATDGLRAKYLEREGYETQVLEFIDMEHTPKNILLRAVKTGRKDGRAAEEIRKCIEFLGAAPTLGRLLDHKGEKE